MHRPSAHRAPALASRTHHAPVARSAARHTRLARASTLLACLLLAVLAAFWAGNDAATAGVPGRDMAQVSPTSLLGATSPVDTPTAQATNTDLAAGSQTSLILVGFVLVGLVAAVILVVLRRRQT